MWNLACGAVFIVLLGATHAVPACNSGCEEKDGSQYCDSTCYTKPDNTLYTISTNIGSSTPKCKAGTGDCPDLGDFSFEDCQKSCTDDASCGAFIKDTNLAGDRCTFIAVCLSLAEAGGLVPCDDCESRRTCSSCPSFTYKGGSTMVHWLCEMQGDAYNENNRPAEGVECKPTANCAKSEDGTPKPALITCAADGNWMDGDNVVDQALLEDLACECQDLKIPEATDTNVFCDSEPDLNPDGDYIIKSGDKCELVCDGQVFIPIECRFTEDKTSASWNIVFDGETVDLGADAKCLACSLDNCQEEPTEPPPFMVNY